MATAEVCLSNDTSEDNAVQFCTLFGDEDGDLVEPLYDEFDMWEQQQIVGNKAQSPKLDQISAFQKIFLEELSKDHDTNRAAANALRRFHASPPSVPRSETPETNAVTFLSMSEENEQMVDHDLDEFDLWQCRQNSEVTSRSEEQKDAISSFQKLFLEELAGSKDRAGAAANALMKLFPSRQVAPADMRETTEAPSPIETSGEQTMKERAAKSLHALYSEEFEKSGDANVAAVAAIQRLAEQSRQRKKHSTSCSEKGRAGALSALKKMLANEVANDSDINGSVARALMRLRAAGNTTCN